MHTPIDQFADATAELDALLRRALAEDRYAEDVTTLCTVPATAQVVATLWAKAPGVIAGLAVAERLVALLDPQLRWQPLVADGATIEAGMPLARIVGPGRAVLSGERTLLNLLQYMSGIATLTRQYVAAVAGTRAIILDTRKTAPGLRLLSKWAVRLGGGQNHRQHLAEMVLIKENHIAAAGGLAAAVARVRAGDPLGRAIEVEVCSLDELRIALELAVDRILLDNMSLDELRAAVALAAGRVPLEASGNITLANVAAVAATGVDYISVGALTHSAPALDLSLLLEAL
ncbi:carboxylating nicotinate-nucleotide diphosphorylase [Kallotenue papyrolyticum]|uniref:carboxylating nicotinate-nucleotide diphosphorylase n=1 Tax=Kallotenue papyrolyticum TaxID=1325125 RepID=UPI00046ED23C|nr:carboxylating nicotinate-nucleotide diphosphorylase [Kallotenue papyrolyticum]